MSVCDERDPWGSQAQGSIVLVKIVAVLDGNQILEILTAMPSVRSLPPPSKKRKVKDDTGFRTSIKRLEDDLTRAISTNASLNPLADLLDLAVRQHDAQNTSKAIYALYRLFVLLITKNKLNSNGDEGAKVVKAWLWERFNTYVEFLGGLLKDEEKTLRVCIVLKLLIAF